MSLHARITISASFFVQDASGPNPDDKAFEIVDIEGDRFDYADDLTEVEDIIAEYTAQYLPGASASLSEIRSNA